MTRKQSYNKKKMAEELRSYFVRCASKNEVYVALIQKPKNNKVTIFLTFNVLEYKNFLETIDNYQLLRVEEANKLEYGISKITIELLGEDSLSQLITDLPELLYQHVENAVPTNIIHQGTKA